MALSRMHTFVSGHVQGVFFRASTRDEGKALGLSGWVRNLRDGRVEVLAEGEESQIDQLESWLAHGPPGAFVDDLTVEKEEIRNMTLQDFKIIN
jgi:acylphosphatase